ncbi:MAG: Hsp20/alpha crystallin family protein [Chitinophagaceae bacterium]|nr:Hsp20/alpha crystallin family protein [Chitinophagaceae bacterium]MCB9046822.1 Hsp20/alpha crystallin family protein [Chitinophagales bacterium]
MYKHRKNFTMTPATFGGLMDGVLNNKWDRMFFDDNWSNVTAPVNIKETDTAYQLDVVAPGLKKEDFDIQVEKDVLSVSFEQKEEQKETTDKMIRNEYKFRSFKRNFTLGDKINAAGISANYADGILSVNLPKAEPNEATTRKIDIA